MVKQAPRVDLSGRRAIVTGASPGSLGAATAKLLHEWGAQVVITTRSNSDTAAAAIDPAVSGHPLELTDRSSVRAFADWYAAADNAGDGLDLLVNNAGIHLDLRSQWSAPTLTADGHEVHWRTNYLGTMDLTHLLLPSLLAAAARTGEARVVNVVSKLHARGRNRSLFEPLDPYHSWDAYGVSKLALIHASAELSRRYGGQGIRAYSLHPGSVYSNIADRGLEGHRVLTTARKVLAPLESRLLLSPYRGAQTSVYCASAPDLAPGYYRDATMTMPSDDALDGAVATRLWSATTDWLGTEH